MLYVPQTDNKSPIGASIDKESLYAKNKRLGIGSDHWQ